MNSYNSCVVDKIVFRRRPGVCRENVLPNLLSVRSDRPTTQQHRHQQSVKPVDHRQTLSTGRHQQCAVLHMSTASCQSASGLVVCRTVILACPEAVEQDSEASWEIEARNATVRSAMRE